MWPVSNQAEMDAISELIGLSDRAAGIVGSAFLEDRLTQLIRRRQFIDDDVHKDSMGFLFRDGGPISSFATKTALAFAAGLITEQCRLDLKVIIKIRNKFAHDLAASAFNQSPIKEHCMSIKLVEQFSRPVNSNEEEFLNDPRSRFLVAVNSYSWHFDHGATRDSLQRPYL
jgi:DNA-binding MltR family transcriptional regulator